MPFPFAPGSSVPARRRGGHSQRRWGEQGDRHDRSGSGQKSRRVDRRGARREQCERLQRDRSGRHRRPPGPQPPSHPRLTRRGARPQVDSASTFAPYQASSVSAGQPAHGGDLGPVRWLGGRVDIRRGHPGRPGRARVRRAGTPRIQAYGCGPSAQAGQRGSRPLTSAPSIASRVASGVTPIDQSAWASETVSGTGTERARSRACTSRALFADARSERPVLGPEADARARPGAHEIGSRSRRLLWLGAEAGHERDAGAHSRRERRAGEADAHSDGKPARSSAAAATAAAAISAGASKASPAGTPATSQQSMSCPPGAAPTAARSRSSRRSRTRSRGRRAGW